MLLRRVTTAAAFAVVQLLTVAACGDDGTVAAREDTAPAPGASGSRYTPRLWYDAELAPDGRHVSLSFDAPMGAGCTERHEPKVDASASEVSVIVAALEPWAPPECAVAPSTLDVDLGAPLGSRALVVGTTRWVFRVVDGDLQLDPSSTPCGRADCSTPSPSPAACETVGDAVSTQIDGSDPGTSDERCDGSFAIATISIGGCPLEGHDRCARVKRAYFVANGGDWRLVTYGELTCEDVWTATRIRYPAPMCTG